MDHLNHPPFARRKYPDSEDLPGPSVLLKLGHDQRLYNWMSIRDALNDISSPRPKIPYAVVLLPTDEALAQFLRYPVPYMVLDNINITNRAYTAAIIGSMRAIMLRRFMHAKIYLMRHQTDPEITPYDKVSADQAMMQLDEEVDVLVKRVKKIGRDFYKHLDGIPKVEKRSRRLDVHNAEMEAFANSWERVSLVRGRIYRMNPYIF